MTTVITTELVLFGLAVFAAISGLWWRVETKIAAAQEQAGLKGMMAHTKAEIIATDFARYQTHAAETYVSKQGMREVRDEIMNALNGMSGNLGRINDRIDRFVDVRPMPRRSSETET